MEVVKNAELDQSREAETTVNKGIEFLVEKEPVEHCELRKKIRERVIGD